MVRLDVDHSRSPVFLYNVGNIAQVGPTVFPITVTVINDSSARVRIGGLRAAWQVTIERPLSGRSIQILWEWGKPEVLETILMDISGETWLDPGQTT